MEYKQTLNMNKSGFPMRGGLPMREPDMLKHWQELDLYNELLKKNEGKPRFALHDGPPFSNGALHMGHALNKCIKDFMNRSAAMRGYYTPYIPGWDNHGMPIESAIIKKNKLNHKAMPIPEFRSACHDFAQHYIDVQMEGFKRLGVVADWEHPYKTMAPSFEAEEVKVFGAMYKKGYIYKGLKPVYWCYHDETALAEAEIEYQDDPCTTVYVKFPLHDDQGKLTDEEKKNLSFVIWTTTIWTLPGNLAIALNPVESYVIVRNHQNGEQYLVAEALMEKVMKVGGVEDYTVVSRHEGAFFENMLADHPFLPKTSRLVLADYVTMDSGTGCVHTAPGFGADDYQTCRRYGMDMVVPVNDQGRHTDYAGKYAGMLVEESNPVILKDMQESGALFASEQIVHSYPHCWRCKKPILFRATEQWFCSVEKFKDQAVEAVKKVHWIPGWGESRMIGMVQERSDWCISRQRTWGVPIPIFFCKDCGKEYITDESISAVAELFRTEGSDAWYEKAASEILPAGTVCPHCGCHEFTKETDIMDVWFDSGVTHASVLDPETRPHHSWPADLYLEGADQYRGWFQSSLLTAVAWRGEAPYREVCTHGWVVDGEGKKMSKSLGNGMMPEDITDQYGADILRLWVASSDYHSDIRVSKEILKQLSEVYRKIRNTARYILGNLYDFDPRKDMASEEQLTDIDRWALARFEKLTERVRAAYRDYEFYTIYHSVHNFCTIDMSNFYLDVLKDRLYVEAAGSVSRRAAQSTIYQILRGLTLLIAPIIPFTCEEIWSYLPKLDGDSTKSVMLHEMPEAKGALATEEFMARWDRIHALRDSVNKFLEAARGQKKIGKSLEAKVVLHADGELYDFLCSVQELMPAVLIVSQVEITKAAGGESGEIEGLGVEILSAEGAKCERCWSFSGTVGADHSHPTLCARCASIVQ